MNLTYKKFFWLFQSFPIQSRFQCNPASIPIYNCVLNSPHDPFEIDLLRLTLSAIQTYSFTILLSHYLNLISCSYPNTPSGPLLAFAIELGKLFAYPARATSFLYTIYHDQFSSASAREY